MKKSSKKYLLFFFILLSFSFSIFSQTPSITEPSLLPIEEPLKGRVEGTGTHFEVTDSEYLNVTLESSDSIKLNVESVPEMVIMNIESASGSASALITLGGFLPSTTYHKYEDDYHNHIVFTTDGNGKYVYTQDIFKPHFVFIQPMAGTKFIKDDVTGGDCTSIGTWDFGTKTCTLTTDLTETIQIDSDDITLDGNNHTITGGGGGFGVYLTGRTGVTIKNLTVKIFSRGIELFTSSGNTITGNTANSNSEFGIDLFSSNSNTLTNNTANLNGLAGIAIILSSNNILTGNTANSNSSFGIFIGNIADSNSLIGNTANLNGISGIFLNSPSSNSALTNNTANSNGQIGILLQSSTGNILTGNTAKENNSFDLSVSAGNNTDCNNTIVNTTGSGDRPIKYFNSSVNLQNEILSALILCDADNSSINNVTIDGSAIKNNNGLFVIRTDNSNFSNINSSNNQIGISIQSSNNNTLTGNTANSNSQAGIVLQSSTGNSLTGNTTSNSPAGIALQSSTNNILTGNTANSNSQAGIVLQSSSNNNPLTGNTTNLNGLVGIALGNPFNSTSASNNTLIGNTANSNGSFGGIIIANSSNNNTIYNNLFKNTTNASFFGASTGNVWNTAVTPDTNIVGGPNIGGNAWSNPTGTGFSDTSPDSDKNGICDLPFTVAAGNIDNFPLKMPSGSSCETAIDLGQGDTCLSNLAITDSVMWFSFVADSPTIGIKVSNLIGSSPMALSINLHEGPCNNLNFLAANPTGDSLGILQNNLAIGNQYLLKIINPNLSNLSFTLCIQNLSSTCTPSSSCSSSSCNLISNGDFANVTSTTTSEIFQSILPCWCCSHGTPQVSSSFGNLTPNYATMYHNGSTGNGEGIITHPGYLNITSGTTYNLIYYIKRNPASSASDGNFYPINNILVVLTNSSSSGLPNCGSTGGTIVPNPPIQQIVDHVTSFSNSNWTKRTVVFQANGNYNQLYIYPRQNFSSLAYNVAWLDIDDISLQTLIADAGLNQAICIGGSVVIGGSPTASGGTSPYTYNWSPVGSLNNPTIANPIATPNSTTTYNVTVTDGNGCFSTGAVTVTVNALPTVSFTIDPNSQLCIGQGINFLDNTTGGTSPYTYSWAFGSKATPSTSTAQNPVVSFFSPGTYPVSLTVTDANSCTSTTTQNITIAPNCCAFASTIVYNTTVPSDITSNTTWSTNYILNKTITIKSPNILIIDNNVTIQFGPFGKIIVENGTGTGGAGAQLIMNSKSRLTSVSFLEAPACPVMWQGVEVWGNSDKASSNAAPYGQGKITMGLFSTIENAHIGVLLGRSKIGGKIIPFDLSFSGGIIIADRAVFNNNAASIQFLPYKYSNASKIQNCTFSAAELLDPGYKTGNSYTYPNPNNPYYAPHHGNNRMGDWHIRMWRVKDVKFFDNIFNDVFYEAILGIDSRFNVKKLSTGNSFNNPRNPTVASGIHIISTVSSPAYHHEISGNGFGSNAGMSDFGIRIEGSRGSDVITGNNFNILAQTGSSALSTGVQLDNSSGFNISNTNNFNILATGVQVTNSGMGGGNIGFPNGNNFTRCPRSITTYGFNNSAPNDGNPKLQIKCNNFDNDLPQYYPTGSKNIYSAGPIANQGALPVGPTDDKSPAGNEFKQVQSPVSNPTVYRNVISSVNFYVYYRHKEGGSAGFFVIPDNLGSPLINITNTGVQKTATSCDDPCTCQNCCRLAQLSAQAVQLQTLKQEYNTALANLDKGQTVQLIAAINHNKPTSPSQLKDMLIAASPLSDEVLFAFINRTAAQTPPGIFKDVLIPNLPVSDTVFVNALLPKLKTLPAGIANQIMDLQGNNPAYRTLTSILRDINSIETQRAQALSGVIGYYVETDSLDKLTALLENEGTDYANQLLFAMYLADSNLTAASAKLNVLPNSSPDEQAYIDLNTLLINLASNNKTVFDMDSAQEQLVREIAALNISSLARTNARAILLLVFNERFEEEIPLPPARMAGKHGDKPIEADMETESSIYPNPASDNIKFNYRLSVEESGVLEIFSIVGNKITSYPISSTQEQFNIPVKSFENGIYLYRFSVNGELMEEGKLVIINK